MAEKINLFDLTREQMQAWFAEMGEKPFRARQLMTWIYHRRILDFSQMTDISRNLQETLREKAHFVFPEIMFDKTARDGTRKWVLRYACGNSIEMVYIPEEGRGTLCISSQAGCQVGCPFCSTAQGGFNRNLTTGEIVVQVWLAKHLLECWGHGEKRKVSNVVLMGMGEPLLNFANVLPATELFLDDWAFGLSKRRVTLSTSGVVPVIEKLREVTDISLAVSLHAPNDELRNKIVPLNQRYGLKALLEACKRYVESNHQHGGIVWEYVMLKGVNDSLSHAQELVDLVKDIPGKVNLIPFNPFPDNPFACSSRNTIMNFQRYLSEHGLITTIRKTRGEDIDAACGQLVGEINNRLRRMVQHHFKEESRP